MARDYRSGGAPEISPLEAMFKATDQMNTQNRTNSDDPQSLERLKMQLTGDSQQQRIQQAQDIVAAQAKAGRKVNAKIGDVDVSQQEDNPLKYLSKQYEKSNNATSKAYGMYATDVNNLRKGVDASKEGLDSINDPKQGGALGIARSNMLRAMGMNRYNGDEAAASLPPALAQKFSALFNGVTKGWDGKAVTSQDDNNPMSPQQKSAADSFFRGHIANAQQQHELIKNKARGSLRASGYYSPENAQTLENGINQAGFDDYTKGILAPKPGTEPSNYKSPLSPSSPPQQQPLSSPSLMDRLKGLNPFGGGQSQPQAPQQPTGGFDPDKYLGN